MISIEKGDGGTGLIYEEKFVIGVSSTSNSEICGTTDKYTAIFDHLDWIDEIVRGKNY